jgi:hypothetical protein
MSIITYYEYIIKRQFKKKEIMKIYIPQYKRMDGYITRNHKAYVQPLIHI